MTGASADILLMAITPKTAAMIIVITIEPIVAADIFVLIECMSYNTRFYL